MDPNNLNFEPSFLDDNTYLESDIQFSNEATNLPPHYVHPEEETSERPALPHDAASANPSNNSANPFKGGYLAAAPRSNHQRGHSASRMSHSPQRPGHINLHRIHARITNMESVLETIQQDSNQSKRDMGSFRQQLVQFERRTLQFTQAVAQLQAYMEDLNTLKKDVQTCLETLSDMTDEA